MGDHKYTKEEIETLKQRLLFSRRNMSVDELRAVWQNTGRIGLMTLIGDELFERFDHLTTIVDRWKVSVQ